MIFTVKNIINTFFFYLRNKISFSRPIKNIPNEDKSTLSYDKEFLIEERQLVDTYKLHKLASNSTITHYKENLYTLKLLEDTLNNIDFNWNCNTLKVLDIGSKNFSYACSIFHFFSYFQLTSNTKRTVYLDGIEIDPYRIMTDLHSRYDYAQHYIKGLSNTRYITKNFLDFHDNKYDFITWFLPFIVKEPLLNWGLPLTHLQPDLMLQHAYKILNSNGIMLVVNQLETEKNIQLKIIQRLGLNYVEIENPYNNIFSPFKYKRYITLIKKV